MFHMNKILCDPPACKWYYSENNNCTIKSDSRENHYINGKKLNVTSVEDSFSAQTFKPFG